MSGLFNDRGELVNETTVSRVAWVVNTVKQSLKCLVDSGATPEELGAVVFIIFKDIATVVKPIILGSEKDAEAEGARVPDPK